MTDTLIRFFPLTGSMPGVTSVATSVNLFFRSFTFFDKGGLNILLFTPHKKPIDVRSGDQGGHAVGSAIDE
jgi:hypothetical protein